MRILGIDTSCDDTSAAVVADGTVILSNIVASQTAIHRKYGGIVPELASRRHVEMIWPVVQEALASSDTTLEEIDALSVCRGPGLIGSLLVGCCFSKALSYVKKKPLAAVNHLEGHIFSAFLEERRPDLPFISLIASGGHTSLYVIENYGQYRELGRTRDDAAGEAYDKVAKLLGLGYPGGPVIDKLASEGDPEAFDFPRAYVPQSFDFSFSGIKTAVKLKIEELHRKDSLQSSPTGGLEGPGAAIILADEAVRDVAASFQKAVVDVLVRKVERAVIHTGIRVVALSGGVAANSQLRRRMSEMAEDREIDLYLPSLFLCTDNGAMIAAAGYHHILTGNLASLDLNPTAWLPL